MVGRFVEQEQLGLRDQRPREQHAAPPASRQTVNPGIGGKVEPLEHELDTLLEPPAVPFLELVLQAAESIEQGRGAAGPDLDRGPMVVADQSGQFPEAIGDDIEHAAIVAEGHVLFEPGSADRRRSPHGAGIGHQLARKDPEQCGLAGPVAADDRDALTGLDVGRYLVEERDVAERNRDAVERQQRHKGT